MNVADALQLLELTTPINKTGLKKAYRDALMVWHPDRFTGNNDLQAKAEAKTYLINEAYALLSRVPEADYPFSSTKKKTTRIPVTEPNHPKAHPSKAAEPPPTSRRPPPAAYQPQQRKSKSAPTKKQTAPSANRIYTNAAWVVTIGAILFLYWFFNQTSSHITPKQSTSYKTSTAHEKQLRDNEAIQKNLSAISKKEQEDRDRVRKITEANQELQEMVRKTGADLAALSTPISSLYPLRRVTPVADKTANSKNNIQGGLEQPEKNELLKHLPTDFRLNSGSVVVDKFQSTNAKGKLTLDNGLTEDAHAKLVWNGVLVASFYVRGGEQFTFDHIPDGSYQLLYCTGFDWNPERRDFARGKSASRYDQPLDFATRRRSEGNQIVISTDVLTLTLHKIINGNAKASSISLDEFDRY
jgi:hypothetical protein